MFDKLDFTLEKYQELAQKVADPAVISDQPTWRTYMKEMGELEPIVNEYKEYKKTKEEIEEAKEILDAEDDEELREMAREEIKENEGKLEELQEDGESGRKKINEITRIVTVGLALIQSFGISFGLRHAFVSDLGVAWSIILSMAVFTAGAVFTMWIGESITEYGVGNGISLIIMVNVLSRVPSTITTLGSYQNVWMTITVIVVLLFMSAFIVVMELAERRIPIQYAKRMSGRKMYGGSTTYIPIRVNMAGVIPIIFAISLISMPQIITGFFNSNPTGWWGTVLKWLNTSHPFGACLYVALIIFFTYFYSAITYNPREIAENLKKNGGFIPGIRPGAPTAEYLKKTSTYVITIGAIMLAIVAVLPIILQFIFKIDNLSISGSSLMIAIGVALETVKQIESQLVMRHYKGFLSD